MACVGLASAHRNFATWKLVFSLEEGENESQKGEH